MDRYSSFPINMDGLSAVLGRGDTRHIFFSDVLPSIIRAALALPSLMEVTGNRSLPMLKQLKDSEMSSHLSLSRVLVRSLLANMFLCTFDDNPKKRAKQIVEALPERSFIALLGEQATQEVAKLRMFVNYFHRTINQDVLRGNIRITRCQTALDDATWSSSNQPLLPMEVLISTRTLTPRECLQISPFS